MIYMIQIWLVVNYREDFHTKIFGLPWQQEFFMEWNHLNFFYMGPSKEHLFDHFSISSFKEDDVYVSF